MPRNERRIGCPLCGERELKRWIFAPISLPILPLGYCYAKCGNCAQVIEVQTCAFNRKVVRLVEETI